MPDSVLQAIKQGHWDFEPPVVANDEYDSTVAMPGSDEKLAILAQRAEQGLPLWHPRDRYQHDDGEDE